MEGRDFLLSKDEISRLEDYTKNKDSLGISDMAWDKYKNGCSIERVHNTRNCINVHLKKTDPPYKFKIKYGRERNRTLGKAMFFFALGNLSGMPKVDYKVIIPGLSVKHRKNYKNNGIERMMEEIENNIENYKLQDISGMPKNIIGTEDESVPEIDEFEYSGDLNIEEAFSLTKNVISIIEENPNQNYQIINKERNHEVPYEDELF